MQAEQITPTEWRVTDDAGAVHRVFLPAGRGAEDAIAALGQARNPVPPTPEEAAAARLRERRSRATLTRGEFLLAALGAGAITEADAETAASGDWPSSFDAFLTGLSSAERIAAKAMWTDSRKIRRDSPLLAQIAAAQGVDDAALDALFGIA